MNLIRCDVRGCNEEFQSEQQGMIGMLPPGWRTEVWNEERTLEVPPEPAQAVALEELGGDVRTVTVRPVKPAEEAVRTVAHGCAHVCPKHRRGYELREGVLSEPELGRGRAYVRPAH